MYIYICIYRVNPWCFCQVTMFIAVDQLRILYKKYAQ